MQRTKMIAEINEMLKDCLDQELEECYARLKESVGLRYSEQTKIRQHFRSQPTKFAEAVGGEDRYVRTFEIMRSMRPGLTAEEYITGGRR